MTPPPPARRDRPPGAFRRAGTAAILLALAGTPPRGAAADASAPRPADPRLAIELVAAAPDIVTPVGCCHDDRGRLLVIESHTHFRPAGYQGPLHDRIRLVEDTDGDGRADRFRTFFEGTRATMGLRSGANGWLYVATRAEVFRIRDTDGDDVAEVREPLLRLETKGDYPHNGLGGLAFDPDGRLLVGLGENLGESYRLVAADGSSWSGGGEGGGVFRCTGAGGGLERVATGFWNPFGLGVDAVGRAFAVDNDPDARPPCRLVEVVPTADYGYRFRYGRGGRHPLQAWNGELPGTLPMAAGTGEAPCAVVPFADALWVSSWGANRIEAFVPRPRGAESAGCTASGRVVVQGEPDFRPVDMAVAPDGSLVVSDWVDRAYELHGRGRLWRIRVAGGASADGRGDVVPLSAGERRARRLLGLDDAGRRTDGSPPGVDVHAALGADDPFLRQAAVAALVTSTDPPPLPADAEPARRLACLQAWRLRAERARLGRGPNGAPLVPVVDDALRDRILRAALADADEAVRLFAVGWIADDRLAPLRADLETILAAAETSPRLLAGALAALAWLDGQGFDGESARRRLGAIWQDAARPTAARAAALALVRPGGDPAAIAALADLARAPARPGDDALAREATRLLALWPDGSAAAALAGLAAERALPASRRADALVGLVRRDAAGDLVAALAGDPDAAVSAAAGALGAAGTPAAADRPPPGEVEAWTRRLAGAGDAAAGWRLFFGSRRARCGDCHALGGRGGAIGPELTGIVARAGRPRVIESLLDPHREIAPAFQSYALTLRDGRVVSGLSAGRADGDRAERIVGSDGRETLVPLAEVESRVPLATSVMPSGLEQGLSDADLRDLLALLAE